MSDNPAIRVLVVDDHALVREGIRRVLGTSGEFEVVAEAGDAEQALRLALQHRPDVVVLDISMPGESGLQAAERLGVQIPGCRILMLSVHDHPEYVLQSVRAGARGYMRKDASPTELRRAIRAIFAGESFFPPAVARQLSAAVREATAREEQSAQLDRLTSREREVLVRIAQGKTNKEIAGELGLSPRTVESYRENLMRKLEIRTVAGLTRFAMEAGLQGG